MLVAVIRSDSPGPMCKGRTLARQVHNHGTVLATDIKPSVLIGIAALDVYFRFSSLREEMRGRHASGFEIRCGRAGRG